MHEGFCNFNAGTLGTSMVEGRISAGVIVGDGSDIGGGASIMGTLSGGGTEIRSRIGERCLLGANAGIGISLGDDCIVEAGLYVTAGTLVLLPDGEVVKARSSAAPQPAVPPQQPDRRGRGPAALRLVGRPERRSSTTTDHRSGDVHVRTRLADLGHRAELHNVCAVAREPAAGPCDADVSRESRANVASSGRRPTRDRRPSGRGLVGVQARSVGSGPWLISDSTARWRSSPAPAAASAGSTRC